MAPRDPPSILGICTESSRLLAKARNTATIDSTLRVEINDLHYRYMVWAGNVGAFAKGTASLDHRLRDEKDVADELILTVVRLSKCMSDILDPPLYEVSEDEALGEEAMSSLSGEAEFQRYGQDQISIRSDSSESTISLDKSTDEEDSKPSSYFDALNDGSGQSEAKSLVNKAITMVDRLYKLAVILRKPMSTKEDSKVQDFLERHDRDEEVLALLNHAELAQSARFHIVTKHQFKIREADKPKPPIPDLLVERIIQSILRRRNKLVYRQYHQEKLRSGASDAIQHPGLNHPSRMGRKKTTSESLSRVQSIDTSKTIQHSEHQAGSVRTAHSGQLSDTVASSINRARFTPSKYAKSVALSRISPSTAERQGQLDIPLAPLNKNENSQEAECPVCFRIINKKEMLEPHWTRHILKDIQPYICLFRGCRKPQTLFITADEWLRHMQSHTSVWCCEVPGHEEEIFDSAYELKNHIKTSHSGSFSDKLLPLLIKRSERVVEDPFIQLASEYDKSYKYEPGLGHQCPLCWEFSESNNEAENGHSKIYQHILGHLESWALLALIEREDHDALDSLSKAMQSVMDRSSIAKEEWDIHDETDLGASKSEDSGSLGHISSDIEAFDSREFEKEVTWESFYEYQNARGIFPDPPNDNILVEWNAKLSRTEISAICTWLCPEPRQRWQNLSKQPKSARKAIEVYSKDYWFFQLPEFQRWANKEDTGCRIILCHGRASTGKTTVNSLVCHHLQIHSEPGNVKSVDPVIPVYLEYGLDISAPNQDILEVIVRFIIKALLGLLDEIPPILREATKVHENGKAGINSRWGIPVVTEMAIAVISRFNTVYVCIDSLDDWHDSDTIEVIKWVERICKLCPNVKFMLLGTPMVRTSFTKLVDASYSSSIDLERNYWVWSLKAGILKNRLESKLSVVKTPEEKDAEESSIEKLVEEYQSWDSLPSSDLLSFQSKQIEVILYSGTGDSSLSASTITSSARITPVLYGNALEIIKRQSPWKADSAFRAISFICFNVDYGKDGKLQTGCLYDLMNIADTSRQPQEKFEALIDDCAGLLVLERSQPDKLDLDKDYIRAIHPSLLEYIRNGESQLPASVMSSLNQQRIFIMQIFLRYFNQDIFWTSPKHFESQKDLDDFKSDHPGFFFAASEWGFSGRFHAGENESNNLFLSELIQRVKSVPTTPVFLMIRLTKWFALRDDPFKPSSLLDCLKGNPDPGYTLTHVAASFGSVPMLEFLSKEGALQPDTEDSFGMTPLIHAIVAAGTRPAVSDLLDTISWLLNTDNGAFGSKGVVMGGIALWYAFSRKQLQIMEVLATFYIEIPLEGKTIGTSASWMPWPLRILELALEKVTENFFEEVAVLIIDTFPEFLELWKLYNRDPKHKQSPLQIAASAGSFRVVNSILRYSDQIGRLGRSEMFTQPSALSLAMSGIIDCYAGQAIVRSDNLDRLNGYELSAVMLIIALKSPRAFFDFVVLADTDTEGASEVDPVSINIRAFVGYLEYAENSKDAIRDSLKRLYRSITQTDGLKQDSLRVVDDIGLDVSFEVSLNRSEPSLLDRRSLALMLACSFLQFHDSELQWLSTRWGKNCIYFASGDYSQPYLRVDFRTAEEPDEYSDYTNQSNRLKGGFLKLAILLIEIELWEPFPIDPATLTEGFSHLDEWRIRFETARRVTSTDIASGSKYRDIVMACLDACEPLPGEEGEEEEDFEEEDPYEKLEGLLQEVIGPLSEEVKS